MDTFEAGALFHLSTPPGQHFNAHSTGRDGAKARMNVAARQKNEKTAKKEINQPRLRAALLRPFKQHHTKTIVCVRRVPVLIETFGKAKRDR